MGIFQRNFKKIFEKKLRKFQENNELSLRKFERPSPGMSVGCDFLNLQPCNGES